MTSSANRVARSFGKKMASAMDTPKAIIASRTAVPASLGSKSQLVGIVAAAIVVGKVGTAQATPDEVLAALRAGS